MSTVLAKELIITVGKGLRIFPIHVDDQRRTLLVAILNHGGQCRRRLTPITGTGRGPRSLATAR